LIQAEEQEQLAAQELAHSRALLEQRTLRSPIDGVVVERHKSPGELANEEPILELVEIDPLHVEVMVPVELFGRIEVGTPGLVRLEAPIGGEHEASVVVVDPTVDGASGTFRVRLELPNPEHRIPAGLECHVQFRSAKPDAGSEAALSRHSALIR
jgi:multidrug efflux pump subunit AcrA (membrane-fusion protein)